MTHIEFVSSPRPTVGVEMELELINRDTRELVSGAHEILGEMNAPHGEAGHPKAKKELLQSTVEIITGICETAADIKSDLAATMAEYRAMLACADPADGRAPRSPLCRPRSAHHYGLLRRRALRRDRPAPRRAALDAVRTPGAAADPPAAAHRGRRKTVR